MRDVESEGLGAFSRLISRSVMLEMNQGSLAIRQARMVDIDPILTIVNDLALRQILLSRSPSSVIENVRDFVVAERGGGEVIGCAALHVVWSDIAEIRSLAVRQSERRTGAGRRLVETLLQEARRLGIPRVYAFTYVPAFFATLGFRIVAHERMPHKVFSDCVHCPKFMACDEVPMELELDGIERVMIGGEGVPRRVPLVLPQEQ